MKFASHKFEALRHRAKIGIAVEGCTWIALAAVVFVFASYAIDRNLRLEVGYRAFLLTAFAVGVAGLVRRHLVRPLRTTLDDDELALAVERQDPGLQEALISAVQFDRDFAAQRPIRDSETLMRQVVADVERRAASLQFGRALDGRRFARFLGGLALGVVLLGAWVVAYPSEARLWALRSLALGSTPWPRDTILEFVELTSPVRVAERDDLTLRVRATGVVPERVSLQCEFVSGEAAERPMEQLGDDTFSITLESLLESLAVHAEGGDGTTEPLRIELVPRPRFTDLALTLHFPAYLGREPTAVDDLGVDVRVPHGTQIEVSARSDKPLASAELVFAADLRLPLTVSDDGATISGRFVPTESGTLGLDGLDRDRLGPAQPPQVYLRLVPDEAPKVDFETRGIGSLITPEARIPGRLVVRDDHGIAAVSASMRITSAVPAADATGEEPPAPFESAPVQGLETFVAGPPQFESPTMLDLQTVDPSVDPIPENRRIRPDQLLSLRFDAHDTLQPTAQQSASEVMTFRIVTREKLLEELRRRQGEQRSELERLIERERALRDELAEITAPASADPRAEQARLAIHGLARQQQTLGRRAAGIGDRYEAILDELLNNRLFEPAVTRAKHAKIVSPLRTLATDEFPGSSAATAAFADSGADDARHAAVAGYDRILATLDRVLAEMEHTEDLAAVLEALRLVIRTEEQARELVQKHRDDAVEGLFDPERRDKE